MGFAVGMFSGREEDWFIWALRFGAYAENLGWNDVLLEAASERSEIKIDLLREDSLDVSRMLYVLLIGKCEGKAWSLVQSAKNHGLEGWRLLRAEYDESMRGRETLLQDIS